MQLRFHFHPSKDVARDASFFSRVLGWQEAWRDANRRVAFHIPGERTQVMLASDDRPAGALYEVDDLDAWLQTHWRIPVGVERHTIPNGSSVGLLTPSGILFYVFDQKFARSSRTALAT